MEEILHAFPFLDAVQRSRFAALGALYMKWNARINVLSRRDAEHLYLHHVLHSLAVGCVVHFDACARVLDVGCGGGFPAVPLAILFPETRFTAIDSTRKKIGVVEAVAGALGLENVQPVWGRVEELTGRFDYVVSRAVAPMPTLVRWVWGRIERGACGSRPNGMAVLKGGDLREELARTGKPWELFPIDRFFADPYFQGKVVAYTPRT